MHGRGGEKSKRARHMLTVSTRGTTIVAADDFFSSSSSPDSFCKDGRKITLGDCALFKSPHDAAPFIGIIRRFTVDKENKLKLGVNWLYRPSEVQLGKGILLEAAPNEVFYSFHRDAIPAASLLHPCKVAFLPKDTELPSGILSFVCRRVYDISNKCLWWLNDKDYFNERQEEVDQLLFRTQIEMHTTVHPGGRSPKPTLQLKASSDSVQNAVSAQMKGKKRDRGNQSSEPIKRERITKKDEGEYGHCKLESFLKSEIAKITDKGGLVDLDGVEKLIQLMLPEASDNKIDLAGRSILAGVIASTEKVECLGQFVHHKGLVVFDEWLQEVRKGKFGDGSSSKECDKSVEEFLLILLRALDKLPINLLALQMCNIGKSVNHLRTHKNPEIQKKARSLVDTWKKRVEAEMSINDSKSGSNQSIPWTSKPRLAEVSQVGRNQGMSSEAAMKSTVTQLSTSKALSVKVVQDEVIGKSASPGSIKSVPSPASASITAKDGVPRTHDLLQTVAKDEKSSSSSQSYNNSQSCSSEHAKTGGLGKEDARSSTAGSVAVHKAQGGSSRHRKSVNGFAGSTASGVQRETTSEKNTPDVTSGDGHSHKFIVKITNRVRGTGLIASPGSSEKHDHFDCSSKEKGDAYQATVISGVNTESWQSNDMKDVVSNNVEGSPAVFSGEDGCRTIGDTKISRNVSSSPVNENRTVNLQEPSLGPINALIDSCVKYSEATVSTLAGDDVGMNLLASVAAGVMTKSSLESPTDSPQRNLAAVDHSYVKNELKVKASSDGVSDSKQNVDGELASQDEEKPAEEPNGHLSSSGSILNQTTMGSLEVKTEEKENNSAVSPVSSFEKTKDRDGADAEKTTTGALNGDTKLDYKKSCCSVTDEDIVSNTVPSLDVDVDMVEGSSLSNPLSESDGKNSGELIEKKPLEKHSDSVEGTNDEVQHSIALNGDLISVSSREMNSEKNDEIMDAIDFNRPDKQTTDCEANVMHENQDLTQVAAAPNHDGEHLKENLNCKEGEKNGGQADPKVLVVFPVQDVDQCQKSRESKLIGIDADEADESTSTTADASSESAVGISDNDTKMGFDLNEGFDVDDGKYGVPSSSTASDCVANVRLVSPVSSIPISAVSSTISSSITVAAAAKGSFVPPEDLLRIKGEFGWKGSAATSAFRPAEPRKQLEVPFGATSTSLSEPSFGKNSRPPLDIDLNIPDERIFEDMNPRSSFAVSVSNNRENKNFRHEICSKSARCSGGFDLDLNQVNDFPDASNYSTNNDRRMDVAFSFKSPSNHLIGERTRGFDLNGPLMDEAGFELTHYSQHAQSNVPSQVPVSGLWMNNAELGNLSSWFPHSNTHANATIPSIMTDRVEHPFPVVSTCGSQRILDPTNGVNPFSPDVYRGPILSSSPAAPFTAPPFQYSVLSFANNFPLPSANYAPNSTTFLDSQGGRFCFPPVHSQLLGPSGQVSTHYPRPYIVGLPDGSNNPEVSKKWGRHGLDLNAGPGCADTEGKDETFAPRQLSVASQTQHEDRGRVHQPSGSMAKRKEPDGGLDGYRQSTWQ